MFTDEHRRTVWDWIRQQDLKVFARRVPDSRVRDAAQRIGLAVGGGPLNVVNLVWLGLASALHTGRKFADVLTMALKLLHDANDRPLAGASRRGHRPTRATTRGAGRSTRRSKHDPRRADPTVVSEEAFVQARQHLPLGFWMALLESLCERFEAEHGQRLRWKRFRLLALDGSCVNLPKWPRLAEHFGTASNGQAGRRPQARMVMLQFPQVRLPWRYEACPLREGERTIAGRLLRDLEPNDLILMDRGFWSYGLFWQIQRQDAFFGIRLMKGVRVKTLRRLGPKERLVRWRPSDRQWKRAGLPPSIDLRLIDYQVKGFRPSVLATSVLDPQVITRDEWVRLATANEAGRTVDSGLYHRRWEIETTFCELKVWQGMEKNLRCRSPGGVQFEIGAHVLLYHLVRWLMVESATRAGVDPLRISFLSALREVLDMRQTLLLADPRRVSRVLLPRLLNRVAGHLVPPRPGRHYSRPHDTKVKNVGKGKVRHPAKLAS